MSNQEDLSETRETYTHERPTSENIMQEATRKAVFTSLCIQTWHTIRKEQEKISKYLATTSQHFKTEPTIRLWNIHCIWGTPIFSSLFTLHLFTLHHFYTDTDTQSDRQTPAYRQADRQTHNEASCLGLWLYSLRAAFSSMAMHLWSCCSSKVCYSSSKQ